MCKIALIIAYTYVHTYICIYVYTYIGIEVELCVRTLSSHLLCTDGHHASLSVLCVQGMLLRTLHYEGERE